MRKNPSRVISLALFAVAGLFSPESGARVDFTLPLSIEGRLFLEAPTVDEQHGSVISLSTAPKFQWTSDAGTAIIIEPFLRWDQGDPNRTHADLREASINQTWTYFEIAAGFKKVFWGVLELNNLVDTINQSDIVEDISGKEKLGQPMINAALITSFGRFDAYAMTGFRERTFPSEQGRPRTVPVIAGERGIFTSEMDFDYAGRWSHSIGILDFALSYFEGTARDPIFQLDSFGQEVFLVPVYDSIRQGGAEVQLSIDSLALKFEGIARDGTEFTVKDDGQIIDNNDFAAFGAGGEFTFSSCFGFGCELGLLAEYYFHSLGEDATSVLDNDLFSGIRLSFNNSLNTRLVTGAVVDLQTQAVSAYLDLKTQLWRNFVLHLRAVGFTNVGINDPLRPFEYDNHLNAELTYFFNF